MSVYQVKGIVFCFILTATIYLFPQAVAVLHAQEASTREDKEITFVRVKSGATPYYCDIVPSSRNTVNIFVLSEYREKKEERKSRPGDAFAGVWTRLDIFSGIVAGNSTAKSRTLLESEKFISELHVVPHGLGAQRKYYVFTVEPHILLSNFPLPDNVGSWSDDTIHHLLEFDSDLVLRTRKKRIFPQIGIRLKDLRVMEESSGKYFLYGSTWDNALWIGRKTENLQQILQSISDRALFGAQEGMKTKWGAMPVIIQRRSGSPLVFFKKAEPCVRGPEPCHWVSADGRIRIGTLENKKENKKEEDKGMDRNSGWFVPSLVQESEGIMPVGNVKDLPFSDKISSFDVERGDDRIALVGSFGSNDEARLYWSVSEDNGKSWSDLQLLTSRDIVESYPRIAWVNKDCFVCFITKDIKGSSVVGVCRIPLNGEKQSTKVPKKEKDKHTDRNTGWFLLGLIVVAATLTGIVIFLLLRRKK